MSEYSLTDHERATLISLRDSDQEAESRRALIILLSADGTPVSAIKKAVKISDSQIYRWRRLWKEKRLGIFPDQPAAASDEVVETAETVEEVAVVEAAEPVPPAPGVESPRLPLELNEKMGVLPDDSMAEAARKVLRFSFERMLLNEPGSRLGENIEAIHDMRVATRRMRSAIQLFRPFFKANAIKPLNHALRDVARLLGEVRDLDVFMDNAQRFVQENPALSLDPLVIVWQKRLNKARRVLIRHLDSKAFAHFVDQFHTFVTTPGAGARALPGPEEAVAYQVRYIAPRLIYEHYEAVRAYQPLLDDAPLTTLHALRIDFKRFRYTLEFFEEILGPELKTVIKATKAMQDHLGDLNDTHVASGLLVNFIDDQNATYSGVPIFMRPDMSGVQHYALATDAAQKRLLETFPAAWADFNRDEVRRALGLAVSVL
jgi:CHAD domain-containing protein/transposase-like protein